MSNAIHAALMPTAVLPGAARLTIASLLKAAMVTRLRRKPLHHLLYIQDSLAILDLNFLIRDMKSGLLLDQTHQL